MQKPRTVTLLQATMCLGASIIGVGVLAFPRITVEYTSTGAPLATIAAVLLMLMAGLVVSYLGRSYPDKTIFEYTDDLFGKWLGKLVLLLLSAYYLELAALAAREFGEVVVTSVLQRTPIEVTTSIMILLAAFASRNTVAVFSRIITFYMPFVYFPALMIVALTLKNAALTNILPALSVFHETTPGRMLYAMLIVAALFQNYIIIGLLTPYMYRPKEVWKSALVGIGSAGMVYIIVVYSTLAVFGPEEMKNLLWPTLELAKTAAVPLLFVERLDPVFLAVWVTAVFTAILASYFTAVQGFSHLFRFEDHRMFATVSIPIIYALAMEPPNIVTLYKIVAQVGMTGLIITIGYPLLLLMVHFIKKLWVRQKSPLQSA